MVVSVNGPSSGGQNLALSALRFNYQELSPSVEKFLRGQAERIRRHCASSIIQIGKALHEAKRHLTHGAFLAWVESEVGIPARTAQAYMRVASWASGKSANVARLPPSALYVLSAGGVPEDFLADVLRRIEAGEHLAAVTMRQELKLFLHQRKDAGPQKEISHHTGISPDPESRGDSTRARSAIAEVVALLNQRLSPMDFAQVYRILTSDRVLSDPHLARTLEHEFRSATVVAC